MKVSIIRCDDYSKVKSAIRTSLELIGGLRLKPNQKILLKVNLLMAKKPEEAVTTHPSVVKAMIELVKEKGAIPWVGDSSGGVGLTANALKVSGIRDAVEDSGAILLNFEETGTYRIKNPNARVLKQMDIAKPILDADIVVSLPKLKTHAYMLYTGAVKNFFGILPGEQKSTTHSTFREPINFANALLDIYEVAKPKLAVMDGVLGMEGEGPSAGKPIKSNLILASYDCVALDVVACRLIGYNPLGIWTNRLAAERGLGVADLEKIEILGAKPEEVELDFEKPIYEGANLIPWITDKCKACGTCAASCPVSAIKIIETPIIDRDKCILCYCCHELCPEKAIELR